MAGEASMGLGALLFFGGTALTFGTMQSQSGGYIFYGAMAVGAAMLLRGIIEYNQGKRAETARTAGRAQAERDRQWEARRQQAAKEAAAKEVAAKEAAARQPAPVPESGVASGAAATDMPEAPRAPSNSSAGPAAATSLPKPTSQKSSIDPDKYYAILAMIAVGSVDGELSPSEMTFLRAYPPQAIGARVERESVATFISQLRTDGIIAQLTRAREEITPEGRETIVRLAIMMSLADGRMMGDEEARVVAIANCLGVAGERLQACVDQAHADYKTFVDAHNASAEDAGTA